MCMWIALNVWTEKEKSVRKLRKSILSVNFQSVTEKFVNSVRHGFYIYIYIYD